MSDFDHYFSDITVEDGPLIIPCPACGGRWLRAHHSRVYGKNTYIHQCHPDEFFDYRERGNWVCPSWLNDIERVTAATRVTAVGEPSAPVLDGVTWYTF